MPPLLTGTWEHALLAAAAGGDSGYLGPTALQKILYFLPSAGAKSAKSVRNR
jgi:hypothetical protein